MHSFIHFDEDSTSSQQHLLLLLVAERLLCKFREGKGLAEQINSDLTYAICFNLANAYFHNKMYEEALNTYQLIVKNKQYPQSGRLRVNMGNIYYEQKKFPQAIKMYRMALDQIPSTGKELRFRIFRNIGNAFVKLGQFQDAVDSYDSIMVGSADIQTAFNLLLCLYVRGDKEKMKRHFLKMLSIPILGMTDDDEEKVDEGGDGGNERKDSLKEELALRHEQVSHLRRILHDFIASPLLHTLLSALAVFCCSVVSQLAGITADSFLPGSFLLNLLLTILHYHAFAL
jgi:intraflagellar transport protein 88